MAGFFNSLYGRLAAVFVCLLCILGAGVLALTNWSHSLYYQEVTQKLNKSLAMYIVQRAPLIEQGQVNHARVKELADLVMVNLNKPLSPEMLSTAAFERAGGSAVSCALPVTSFHSAL